MGRVFKFGDAISTDAIIPGRYNVTTDAAALGKACFIEARPDFSATVQAGDVIVGGRNFGCGSSREHAPMAIKAAGVQVVIARTFARIFYRNAINIGLPVITCDALYDAVRDGDAIAVDVRSGVIQVGATTFQGDTPGPVAFAIMEAGTLIDLIKSKGWAGIQQREEVSV
ncbi:MAG: 3-isopropylmalate dehydratase small subunit [Candidatus Dormibacteraeota bacterium]|nr:3-isopropylmalate dehydratase small subunit [Candidatus Dormibacteraeota bacterium]